MSVYNFGSQASLGGMSASGFTRGSRKTTVDGEEYNNDYIVKAIYYNSLITIQTPELIKQKVQGDKLVMIRFMYINDQNIAAANRPNTIFVATALQQRNNFDQNGKQSQVIGYGYYCKEKDAWILDSQQFEMDSIKPIQINIQQIDRATGLPIAYAVPNDQKSYIYADIEAQYGFL